MKPFTTDNQTLSEADPGGDMILSWVYPAEISSFGTEFQGEMCSCQPYIVLTHLNLSLQLTPIISDPEYLLDQHILISIKSSDSDESYGEGCIALRIEATESLAPIHTVLTHHGEKTGVFQGEIKLQTSQGKQREKLYDFVKIERDEITGQKPKNISNLEPNKDWDQTNRKSKSTHLMAREAAAIARHWGSAVPSPDSLGKEDILR